MINKYSLFYHCTIFSNKTKSTPFKGTFILARGQGLPPHSLAAARSFVALGGAKRSIQSRLSALAAKFFC